MASQRFMTALEKEQEIVADFADMIGQVYALESALLAGAQAGRSRTQLGRGSRGHDRPPGR